MSVYLYGEDGITFGALCKRMPDILGVYKLEDATFKEVYYRPSFGRGGKGRRHIGEFDFLIATKRCYLLGEVMEQKRRS